jgi:hypothetical protein
LARVALRAASGVRRSERPKYDDNEIEGVGEEKASGGVVNDFEVKDEERRYEEGEGDEELGELAKGKQADLKGRAWRSVPGDGTIVKGECTPEERKRRRDVHEIVRRR